MSFDQRIIDTFGGNVPAGFTFEYEQKLKFMHGFGIAGPLRNLALLELLWAWRDFIPGPKDDPQAGPLTRALTPPEEEEDEPEPEPVGETPKQKFTWKTLPEGERVAAFLNGQVKHGTFQGHSGTKVKVAFNGDTRKYRILNRDDVDIDG